MSEWTALIDAAPLTRHMELVTWLKTEHGLGHGHANALVAHALAQRGGAQRPSAEPGPPPAVTES